MNLLTPGIYVSQTGERYELLDVARRVGKKAKMVIFRQLDRDDGYYVADADEWQQGLLDGGGGRIQLRPDPSMQHGDADAEPLVSDPDPKASDEVSDASLDGITAVLKRYYGYETFREGQRDVIDAVLAGRDVLCVMPTGGGKSICYQLPALIMDGLTVVISPLISLMQDQVRGLVENGIAAAYINSSLTEAQIARVQENLLRGRYKILYLAPERLASRSLLQLLREVRVSLVAVDEAHCISQWGQDFRPSYLKIPEFVASLGYRPPICALTATATPHVRQDILKLLELGDAVHVITGFDRKNLYYSISEPASKPKELIRLLRQYPDMSGIVYCATRKKVDEVWTMLLKEGFRAVHYHAGMPEEERTQSQNDFMYDQAWIIVATNAFGMGIDKSNVRFVIHYNMPGDLESYYQEAGRAGRDGERADCHLLYGVGDIQTQRYFIQNMGENAECDASSLKQLQYTAETRLRGMIHYATTQQCLRYTILKYFGENPPESCGFCLRCRVPAVQVDCRREAQCIIMCINQVKQRFGRGMIVDILLGSNRNDRIAAYGLDRISSYGALRHLSAARINPILDRMLELDAIRIVGSKTADATYQIIKLGENAQAVLDGELMVAIPERQRLAKKMKAKPSLEREMGAGDRELFQELRRLRKDLADRRRVPAFYILPDQALRDIAVAKPMNRSELQRIKGIGQAKLDAYGEEILHLIRTWINSVN